MIIQGEPQGPGAHVKKQKNYEMRTTEILPLWNSDKNKLC